MASLTCNDSRATAYSACWNGSIVYLHTHTISESQAFYNDGVMAQGKKAIWLYMPRDEDEYVSQIWKRSRRLTRELALLVSIHSHLYAGIVTNGIRDRDEQGPLDDARAT